MGGDGLRGLDGAVVGRRIGEKWADKRSGSHEAQDPPSLYSADGSVPPLNGNSQFRAMSLNF